MRALFFEYIHSLGGAQIANIRLIDTLRQCNDDQFDVVDVFGTCKSFNSFVASKSINHTSLLSQKALSVSGNTNLLSLLRTHLKIVRILAKVLRTGKYDIVWTSSEKALYTLLIARLLSGAGSKICFYSHGYDRLFRFKKLFYAVSRRMISQVWVLSEHFKEIFIKRGVPGSKIFVIPNAVDVTEIRKTAASGPDSVLKRNPDQVVLLLPATVLKDKGIMDAMKAVAVLVRMGKNVTLYLAGSTQDEVFYKQVIEYIRDNNLHEHIVLLGWRKDILALMSSADIVLLPSYSEGMPLVLLEAMSLRKPVIATKVGAIPDMIAHGENGFIIERNDVNGIVESVRNITENNLQAEFGINGESTIKKKFSREFQIKSFDMALKSLN